ncbi:MAG: DnaJ domain-containing protein [bacterium]
MAEDFYEILGVNRNASQKEIESAFKKLALEFHPDRHHDNPLSHLAEERMKLINEAYSVLKNPSTRRQYDSGGIRRTPPPQPASEPAYHEPFYETYQQTGKDSEYSDHWGEGSEFYGADPARIRQLRDEALNLFNIRNFRRAIKVIDQVIRLVPEDSGAHNLKALALIELSEYDKAAYSLSNAIRIEPDNAIYYFNRGACYVSMRRNRLAVRDLEKATQLDRSNPQFMIGLASALHVIGQHIKARKIADDAYSIDPNHPAVRQYMNRQQERDHIRQTYYRGNVRPCTCCPGIMDCLCCAMCCQFCCTPCDCILP